MSAAEKIQPVPKPGLVAKLAAVMASVSHVEKSGRNTAQGYSYATEADVLAAVRKGLAERQVMLTPKVDRLDWRQIQGKNGPIAVATVHVTFTAHDGETGETMEVASTVGEGMDSGDKAVFKAMTGATKYAVLKLFLIPTGDDPEKDDAPETRTTQQANARAEAIRQQATRPAPQQQTEQLPARQTQTLGPLPTSLPKYGRLGGSPIEGAPPKDLEWYAANARKSMDDPAKAKWRDKEAALVLAISREIARQGVGLDPAGEPPPHGDEDAPF